MERLIRAVGDGNHRNDGNHRTDNNGNGDGDAAAH
jgi:hypothetical protein